MIAYTSTVNSYNIISTKKKKNAYEAWLSRRYQIYHRKLTHTFRFVKFREYNLMPNRSVWTTMFYSTLPVSLKRKKWITFLFFFEKDIIALDLIAYIRWEPRFNNISNSCRVLHCITHMLYGILSQA